MKFLLLEMFWLLNGLYWLRKRNKEETLLNNFLKRKFTHCQAIMSNILV